MRNEKEDIILNTELCDCDKLQSLSDSNEL